MDPSKMTKSQQYYFSPQAFAVVSTPFQDQRRSEFIHLAFWWKDELFPQEIIFRGLYQNMVGEKKHQKLNKNLSTTVNEPQMCGTEQQREDGTHLGAF